MFDYSETDPITVTKGEVFPAGMSEWFWCSSNSPSV